MRNMLFTLGVILLIVGLMGLTIKNSTYAFLIPGFVNEYIRYIIIGGVMLTLFGLAGFIGVIIGGILSLLIVFGGVV